MSLHALFPDAPTPPRATRHAMPLATDDDMARKREIHIRLTSAAPVQGWFNRPAATPIQAVASLLDHLSLSPLSITAEAQPVAPDTVEFRDNRDPDQPRRILALGFEGLNIAEARRALAELRAPPQQHRKGSRR